MSGKKRRGTRSERRAQAARAELRQRAADDLTTSEGRAEVRAPATTPPAPAPPPPPEAFRARPRPPAAGAARPWLAAAGLIAQVLEETLATVITRLALERALGRDSWVGAFVRALAERFHHLDGHLARLRRLVDERAIPEPVETDSSTG
jgi:hypothetical protein